MSDPEVYKRGWTMPPLNATPNKRNSLANQGSRLAWLPVELADGWETITVDGWEPEDGDVAPPRPARRARYAVLV